MTRDSPTPPRTFIAYRPFGAGLRCAIFYFEIGPHVYGWWIGRRRSRYYSAYFKLEDFFSARSTLFYATGGMDLYGGWRFLYSARTAALGTPLPVEDDAAHELDRLQGIFAAEWLFFEDDPGAAAEREAYEKLKMPLRRVNIRASSLNRLIEKDAELQYLSHDFDMDVLDYLQRHWPLDYRKPRKSGLTE
ncbi:MAG: hypothetical protein ACXWCY_21485 [Burkholderiales bacterium]